LSSSCTPSSDIVGWSAPIFNDPSIACPCPCDPASVPTCGSAGSTVGPLSGQTITETLSPTIPFNYTLSGSGGNGCHCGTQLLYDWLHNSPNAFSISITE
jgi:hypothetical protein